MGQTQNPISAGTQQLNKSLAAVAANDGTATFTFENPPTGWVWTGTLTCPSAPTLAQFAAKIGATSWGTWGGNSVAGPVQALSSQQLVVTATGLVPGTTYDLEWNGSSDQDGLVQPIYPDANSSAVLAGVSGFVTTGDEMDLLSSGTLTTGALVAGGLQTAVINVANLQRSYGALLFVWQPSGGGSYPAYVCAQAQVSGQPAAFSAAFGSQPGNIPMQGIVPFANRVGDGLTFTAYTFAAPGTIASYSLFGLTSCPISVRPDGRAYPIGALGVGSSSTGSVAALLGALTNARYLLKASASFAVGPSTLAWGFNFKLNTLSIAYGQGGANIAGQVNTETPAGQLCDPNTAVGWSGGGGTIAGGNLVYDIVPA